ncbi:AAA-like domain-containing protein [Candidatus Entotheonella palauensis]|uniref:AAA+ ATPase domain-containing protein n=1 Tax=Candidatus Entotheonella gemina TaxID=1429439 RepID=W4LJX6_9BACT|nr:AAA-like domain-containing protein [Candidatus Entotheonella palauensis]ETW98272.1 MAG: hypothetical protein ETSY2_43065 [Candidatus Entotheonella gemina]
MRFFNTAGPVKAEIHYCVPPLERFDLDDVLMLIRQQKYFVLHAPRQTGKTSALLALMDYLNSQGQYRCVYVNVEVGQSAREDVGAAMQAIVGALASSARRTLNDTFVEDIRSEVLTKYGSHGVFGEILSRWAANDAKPLIVFIDEIDALVGDTLVTMLRQLRAGYSHRPKHFPQSIVLCGVRDVRDYRLHLSNEKAPVAGGSAFNIRAESLRISDFSQADIETLYQQHTDATGQPFAPGVIEQVWALTEGQPWLVNALAYDTCFRNKAGRDRGLVITPEAIEEAKEALILRRETHLDQLVHKLQETRVQRVIEPVLAGEHLAGQLHPDDVAYAVDLGLVKQEINGALRLANAIYQEVIPRELAWDIQSGMSEEPQWYVQPDGRLDLNRLLSAFQTFFREHAEHWIERFQYKEAGPQLLMQAFLQRIVNGGGRIEREYGLGRMRTDLLVIWPYPGGVQKAVIELKILYKNLEQTIEAGLEQTWAYMDRCATADGHLVIFDRTPGKPWEDKIFQRQGTFRGHVIEIWGM